MKLYNLPAYQDSRPKIFGLSPNGDPNGWVEFDHIDGMYSLCFAYDSSGYYLGTCHLQAWTPLKAVEGGWEIDESQG